MEHNTPFYGMTFYPDIMGLELMYDLQNNKINELITESAGRNVETNMGSAFHQLPAPTGIVQGPQHPPNQHLVNSQIPDFRNFILGDRVTFEQPSLMPQYYPHHNNQAINPFYLNRNQHLACSVVDSLNQPLNGSSHLMPTLPKPLLSNYPPQPELAGLRKEVKVVYGNHPCDFYCQLVENFHFLSNLTLKLNAIYADKSKNCVMFPRASNRGRARVSRAGACVANCNGNWFRAKMISYSSGGGIGAKVEVMLVDYGSVWHIDAYLVKEIEEEFLTFPPLAYRCTLDGVEQNATGNSKIKRRFEKAVVGKQLEAAFIMPSNNSKYPVILREKKFHSLDADSCINNLFMNKLPAWRPCNGQEVREHVIQEQPVPSGIIRPSTLSLHSTNKPSIPSIPAVMVPGSWPIIEDSRPKQQHSTPIIVSAMSLSGGAPLPAPIMLPPNQPSAFTSILPDVQNAEENRINFSSFTPSDWCLESFLTKPSPELSSLTNNTASSSLATETSDTTPILHQPISTSTPIDPPGGKVSDASRDKKKENSNIEVVCPLSGSEIHSVSNKSIVKKRKLPDNNQIEPVFVPVNTWGRLNDATTSETEQIPPKSNHRPNILKKRRLGSPFAKTISATQPIPVASPSPITYDPVLTTCETTFEVQTPSSPSSIMIESCVSLAENTSNSLLPNTTSPEKTVHISGKKNQSKSGTSCRKVRFILLDSEDETENDSSPRSKRQRPEETSGCSTESILPSSTDTTEELLDKSTSSSTPEKDATLENQATSDLNNRSSNIIHLLGLVAERVEKAIGGSDALRQFGDSILQYKDLFLESMENSVANASKISQEEVERIVGIAENHWLIEPDRLELWIALKHSEFVMVNFMEQIEGIPFLANENELKDELGCLQDKFAVVLTIPSLDEWQKDISEELEIVDPFTTPRDTPPTGALPWQLNEETRVAVIDQIHRMTYLAESYKASEQWKFFFLFLDNGGICGHFNIYRGETVLRSNLDKLPDRLDGLLFQPKVFIKQEVMSDVELDDSEFVPSDIQEENNSKKVVAKKSPKKINLPAGEYATNCDKCNVTCCRYTEKLSAASEDFCSVCPGKCSWTSHSFNTSYFLWWVHMVSDTNATDK